MADVPRKPLFTILYGGLLSGQEEKEQRIGLGMSGDEITSQARMTTSRLHMQVKTPGQYAAERELEFPAIARRSSTNLYIRYQYFHVM